MKSRGRGVFDIEQLNAQTEAAAKRRLRRQRAAGLLLAVSLAAGLTQDYRRDSRQKQEQIVQARRLERMAGILANMSGVSAETVRGDNLKRADKLPGRRAKISAEVRKELEEATVQVLQRPKGSQDDWNEHCTGTKVSINNSVYILTAGHCITSNEQKGGYDPAKPAVNVYPTSYYEYAVADAGSTSTDRMNGRAIIARIDGISLDTTGNDIALMSPIERSPKSDSRSFSAISAINLDNQNNLAAPVQGEPVALYSLPMSSGHEPVPGTGVYLGRVQVSSDPRPMDLVGIHSADISSDPCYFGSSGSSGRFKSRLLTGPLSIRNGLPSEGGVLAANHVKVNYEQDMRNRLEYEEQTGVNMSEFTVICGFTAPSPNNLNILVTGFNVFPDRQVATIGMK